MKWTNQILVETAILSRYEYSKQLQENGVNMKTNIYSRIWKNPRNCDLSARYWFSRRNLERRYVDRVHEQDDYKATDTDVAPGRFV